MDREALRILLDRESVNPNSYGLEGADGLPVQEREERYFMEHTASGWSVYYSERGLRSGEQSFTTEEAACQHLLDLLLRDRTTRMR